MKLTQEQIAQILGIIKTDPTISEVEKEEIQKVLYSPTLFSRLFYGTGGAALAHAISTWLKLDSKAKLLLVISGFGLAQLFLDRIRSDDFVKFNKKTRTYEIGS